MADLRRRRVRLPTRDELKAERIRRSLSTFILEAWPLVEPGTRYVDNWHVGVIAEHLEAVSRGEIQELIINIPPRAMKSLTTGVFWQAWEWLSRPEGKWLTMSYAQTLSLRDATRTRRLVQHRGLRDADPTDGLMRRRGYAGLLELLGREWGLTSDVNAKGRFENSELGYRIATSFGGVATGEGGDRILIDDPHSAKQARSDRERAASIEWYDETIPTRLNDPKTSATVVVMQRLHSKDLTGHLLEEGTWTHLCLPGMFERGHPHAYIKDPRTEDGEVLDAERLGPERLAQLAVKLGSYGFAGQIQQRPSPKEGGILKRPWFRRFRTFPKGRLHLITAWDCAFKGDDDSDYVVGQAWAKIGADAFLVGQVRGQLDYPQTKAAIRAMDAWLTRHYPIISSRRILVEDAANGPAVIAELKREISGVIPVPTSGGKVARAHAVGPMLEAGNVHLPAGTFIPCPPPPAPDPEHPEIEPPEWEPTRVEDLIHEATSFPTGPNDDQVDAMTHALVRIASTGSATIPSDDVNPAGDVNDETLTGDLLERQF